MTPNELLESVKARFPILLHSDEDALQALLSKAIGAYQDLAGFMARTRIKETDLVDGAFPIPVRFLNRVAVKDAQGTYVTSQVWGNEMELGTSDNTPYPLTLIYLENLRDSDYDSVTLPSNSIGLISDYLELLIASPNADRMRRIAVAGKYDASDIPTETDLAARRTELELKISSSQAMMPVLSI